MGKRTKTEAKAGERPGTLGELAADPDNPREISAAAAQGLGVSLERFGDLSGVTFNLRTRQLVTGHQRVDQLVRLWGKLEIVPLGGDRGQVVLPNGEAIVVRFVDWPADKQRRANIAANAGTIQGTFTDDLQIYLADFRATDAATFDALLLDGLETGADPEKPELRTVDVMPPPKMTWVLVGIPTVRFGEIAETVERLAGLPDVILETSSNARDDRVERKG